MHPPGVVEWGTTPKDFFEKKVAIMFTTTGNLTNVKNNAKFDFGVGMIPGNKRKGSPTGGGNFYIFKKATPAQQEAAFKFIKWVTQPERAAQWSMDTGYVAVSEAAYETRRAAQVRPRLPAALVARDQLPLSVAEFSTHDNQRVTKALNDGLQAALTGTKTPAQAMQDAQREADRILRIATSDAQRPTGERAGRRRQPRGHPRLAAAAAGAGAAGGVHALAGGRDLHRQLPFHAQGQPPAACGWAWRTTRPWPTTRCSGRR